MRARSGGTDSRRRVPGFSLEFEPTKADVSASGDVGYTSGTYQSTVNGISERGKTSRSGRSRPTASGRRQRTSSMRTPAPHPPRMRWWPPRRSHGPTGPRVCLLGPRSPSLQAIPPRPDRSRSGRRCPPATKWRLTWHPGDENLTILSGTVALGGGCLGREVDAVRRGRRLRCVASRDAPLLSLQNRRHVSGARHGTVCHHVRERGGRSATEEVDGVRLVSSPGPFRCLRGLPPFDA